MPALTCAQRKTALTNELNAIERLILVDRLDQIDIREKVKKIKDIVCAPPVGDCCAPASEALAAMLNDDDTNYLYADGLAALSAARDAVLLINCGATESVWKVAAYDAMEAVERANAVRVMLDTQLQTWKNWYKGLTDQGCHIVLAPEVEEEE